MGTETALTKYVATANNAITLNVGNGVLYSVIGKLKNDIRTREDSIRIGEELVSSKRIN
jgi:hypothetical protein